MKSRVTRIKDAGANVRLLRTRCELTVLDGPDRGRSIASANQRITVGTAEQNDLMLTDPSVSRHHVQVELTPAGFKISDLNSTNGTTLGAVRLEHGLAHGPVELRLGDTRLRIAPGREEEIDVAEEDHFGVVLGRSPAMRELFAKLRSVAHKDVTVLLEGETGTGKELIAHTIHDQSSRRNGPYVIVDCGAIPPSLIESELLGHERGAFTGAVGARVGAFEEADGGTIFLDEIGELEMALQPRLLRVLERREVKRVGGSQYRPVDVRVIAATNRNLHRDVNDGTFRADLYYRLAVVHVRIPPLRERREDVELMTERMLPMVAERMHVPVPEISDETMHQLVQHHWRGNGRELRNFLERLVALSQGPGPVHIAGELELAEPAGEISIDALEHMPFREAKARWTEHFDITYLARLLERCGYNVAEASRQSGIDRVHLFRLIKRYKLRR